MASSLSVDMPTSADPIHPDDWIATAAGSRYVVTHARPVKCRPKIAGCDRCADQVMRWAVSVERLPKHEPIPDDVRVINFHWHKREQHRGASRG